MAETPAMTWEQLYNHYRDVGHSEVAAAQMVDDGIMAEYLDAKRRRAERRVQAEKHDRRPRQAA